MLKYCHVTAFFVGGIMQKVCSVVKAVTETGMLVPEVSVVVAAEAPAEVQALAASRSRPRAPSVPDILDVRDIFLLMVL